MRQLYNENTANYPRLSTDIHFADYKNSYNYEGFVDWYFKLIEKAQLTRPELFARFTEQFSFPSDDCNVGWRGEFWGKMTRGACFVYSYTKNPELYETLKNSVLDIISKQDDLGRISTYSVEREFDGWDLWSRKYVMLGLEYFLEISEDEEVNEKVIASLRRQADYVISKIGNTEGKREITSCTRHWRGLNSSSILEPIVRLYSLTKDGRYLDFAKYIVDSGATDVVNIFDLAYENELYPYQYPVTKAYEMTSCFEGLLEYYRIVGTDRYKTALINFADRVLESDFTVIGCSGCTHELFDHSAVRQANTTNFEIMQETCVTVTLMKFFYQLHLLTGDTKYVDAFERSFYNAYLGAVNTEGVVERSIIENHPELKAEPLPFDSYSPLTAGRRGYSVGGMQIMEGGYYYGCCACIGSLGIGLVPKVQLLTTSEGFALNLYINGEAVTYTEKGEKLSFNIETDYPREGRIVIKPVLNTPASFSLSLRIPEWSLNTSLTLNGKGVKVTEGYTTISREWQTGDELVLTLDMRTQAILPISYGTQVLMNKVVWSRNYIIPTFDCEDPLAHRHIAFRRGPVMLTLDNRLGMSVDEAVSFAVGTDGYIDTELLPVGTAPYKAIVEASLPLSDGRKMTVTDYASAGKLWNEESRIAVWHLTE